MALCQAQLSGPTLVAATITSSLGRGARGTEKRLARDSPASLDVAKPALQPQGWFSVLLPSAGTLLHRPEQVTNIKIPVDGFGNKQDQSGEIPEAELVGHGR